MSATPPSRTGSVSIWRDAVMLRVEGIESREFLQGYLSSNTERLNDKPSLPMAICNLKGRVVASGWALDLAPDVGLIVHASLTETVRTFLKPYVTFSKCTLAETLNDLIVTPDGVDLGIGFAVEPCVGSPEHGASAASEDFSQQALEHLTEARFVFVSEPISGQFLPQVLGLADVGAVDFDKGCYLGQEIVARAEFRGAVKRKLVSLEVEETPIVGTELGDRTVVVQNGAPGTVLAVTSV